MKLLKTLSLVILLVGCQSEDSPTSTANSSVLSEVLGNLSFENGAVIACAASDLIDSSQVNVYFYPESGAENFRLYETELAGINPNDFSNYTFLDIDDLSFFNGFLRQYKIISDQEKWFIVTFTLNNEIKVSNPIRSKQFLKPTVFDQEISIDQNTSQMPVFSWEDDNVGDNAIYFQIVSDIQDNVFSATYTFESNFQYYNTSNVVLNITEGHPQDLIVDLGYKFTLMDVSEDNWVNILTLSKNFIVE